MSNRAWYALTAVLVVVDLVALRSNTQARSVIAAVVLPLAVLVTVVDVCMHRRKRSRR